MFGNPRPYLKAGTYIHHAKIYRSLLTLHVVLGGIPVFLVRYGIKFRPVLVLLYKDTVCRYFN